MKRKRLVLTVTPRKDGWTVDSPGCVANLGRFCCVKVDAVALGRRMALAHRAAGGLAQLRIKGRNGRIQTEHSYGHDPRRFKG
jgi:Uncharacterized protein conserved in bacteria (DUF2188)